MKKLLTTLTLALLLVVTCTMWGCSSYGSIKKAFEKAGYQESQTLENIAQDIVDSAEEKEIAVTLHGFTKSDGLASNAVFILEFKSTEDMKRLYDESATLRGFIEDVSSDQNAKDFQKALEDAGYAKGNCLLVGLLNPLMINEVTNIIKGA